MEQSQSVHCGDFGSPDFKLGHHPSVAVTAGILDLLDDEELESVLAHELGHVRNRDILISSIVATLAGAITMLAHGSMVSDTEIVTIAIAVAAC